MLVRPNFGYRLAELGNFQNLMRFIRQIAFYPTSGAAVGGYRRQESVMASNRLLPLRRHKEEASHEKACYSPSVEFQRVSR